MPKVLLELIDTAGGVRLRRTDVKWGPNAVIRASEANWRGANTQAIIWFFTQYKAWGLRQRHKAGLSEFELRGVRGELAASLHDLLDNSHRTFHGKPHWASLVFGRVPNQPDRCRLSRLVEVPEASGEFVARIADPIFSPDDVRIVRNGKELTEERELEDLLTALGSPNKPPGPVSEKAQLTAQLSVRAWSPEDMEASCVYLCHPGLLHIGDLIRVEAHVSMPAYLYLVWIDSRGVATPLHPWVQGDWEKRAGAERRVTHVELPGYDVATGLAGWPIEGPPGIETLVLMAKEKQLSRGFRLRERLLDFPPRTIVVDPTSIAEFECRRSDRLGDARRMPIGIDKPSPIRDVMLERHTLLRDRLAAYFVLIKAFSFTTAHRKESGPDRGLS